MKRVDLPLEPEVDATGGVAAEIFGPQCGHRLAHCADRVFHSASSDGVLAGSDTSVSVLLTEDLEDGDGVGEVAEKGVKGVGVAELQPEAPSAIVGTGSLRADAGSDRRLNKAEISAECI